MTESLKERLRAGATVLGGWLSLGSPAIAEIFCRAGYDFLVVDLEHTTTSLETTEQLIRTVDLCGAVPLVRLSSLDPVQIKRVLDAGAHGVVVPMVTCAGDVERAARAMHYPPRGDRGVGLGRAQAYGASFREYVEGFAGRAVLVPQIENREAVAQIDAILAHPDVDACLVGPFDLSASLGVPGDFEHPTFRAALDTIERAAARAGVALGFHQVAPNPSALRQKRQAGYRFLVYGVDFSLLDAACRDGVVVRDE